MKNIVDNTIFLLYTLTGSGSYVITVTCMGGFMPIRRTLLLVAITSMLLHAQPKIVVFDFESVGVDSVVVLTSSRLLKNHLSKSEFFTMVEVPSGVRCYTITEATERAKSLRADKAVIGSMSLLGKKIIISYQLIDVNTSTVEFRDKASAVSIEDLDVTMERIGNAIETQKPFAATIEVGKETEAEKPPFKTRRTFGTIIFKTGYTFPLSHNKSLEGLGRMLFTLDAAVSYETPNLMTEALMGICRGKNKFKDYHFDLFVYKVFSQQDISSYIGGGVGVHKLSIETPEKSESDDGIALSAGGGLILFRTYYFRVLAGLRASAVFTEDLGTFTSTALTFGITSPETGSKTTNCVLGVLGAFFISGIILVLTS